MSTIGERLLLEGMLLGNNGTKQAFAPSFITEKDLDHSLWFNPEAAPKQIESLLKQLKGELSPALCRIALKGLALPLYFDEFYGHDTTDAILDDIATIPERTSEVTAAYLELEKDDSVNQAMLKQAIDDISLFQIGQLIHAETPGSLRLLPSGPEQDQIDRPATFTLLRPAELGRAILTINSVAQPSHAETPELKKQRVLVSPKDMLINGASRFDLAEALTTYTTGTFTTQSYDLVEHAKAHVQQTVEHHFNTL